MPKIRGFHHVLHTKHGQAIVLEQHELVKACGLEAHSETIHFGYLQPGFVSSRDGISERCHPYEGHTLEVLWQICQSFDGLVWYIHTKGASLSEEKRPSAKAWRRLLEMEVIENWESCVDKFIHKSSHVIDDTKQPATLDCYGAYLPHPNLDTRYFFPGNFWWARSDHIRRLPSPREWAEKLSGRAGENVRYGYEDWVTLSVPGVVAEAAHIWNPDNKPELECPLS